MHCTECDLTNAIMAKYTHACPNQPAATNWEHPVPPEPDGLPQKQQCPGCQAPEIQPHELRCDHCQNTWPYDPATGGGTLGID